MTPYRRRQKSSDFTTPQDQIYGPAPNTTPVYKRRIFKEPEITPDTPEDEYDDSPLGRSITHRHPPAWIMDLAEGLGQYEEEEEEEQETPERAKGSGEDSDSELEYEEDSSSESDITENEHNELGQYEDIYSTEMLPDPDESSDNEDDASGRLDPELPSHPDPSFHRKFASAIQALVDAGKEKELSDFRGRLVSRTGFRAPRAPSPVMPASLQTPLIRRQEKALLADHNIRRLLRLSGAVQTQEAGGAAWIMPKNEDITRAVKMIDILWWAPATEELAEQLRKRVMEKEGEDEDDSSSSLSPDFSSSSSSSSSEEEKPGRRVSVSSRRESSAERVAPTEFSETRQFVSAIRTLLVAGKSADLETLRFRLAGAARGRKWWAAITGATPARAPPAASQSPNIPYLLHTERGGSMDENMQQLLKLCGAVEKAGAVETAGSSWVLPANVTDEHLHWAVGLLVAWIPRLSLPAGVYSTEWPASVKKMPENTDEEMEDDKEEEDYEEDEEDDEDYEEEDEDESYKEDDGGKRTTSIFKNWPKKDQEDEEDEDDDDDELEASIVSMGNLLTSAVVNHGKIPVRKQEDSDEEADDEEDDDEVKAEEEDDDEVNDEEEFEDDDEVKDEEGADDGDEVMEDRVTPYDNEQTGDEEEAGDEEKTEEEADDEDEVMEDSVVWLGEPPYDNEQVGDKEEAGKEEEADEDEEADDQETGNEDSDGESKVNRRGNSPQSVVRKKVQGKRKNKEGNNEENYEDAEMSDVVVVGTGISFSSSDERAADVSEAEEEVPVQEENDETEHDDSSEGKEADKDEPRTDEDEPVEGSADGDDDAESPSGLLPAHAVETSKRSDSPWPETEHTSIPPKDHVNYIYSSEDSIKRGCRIFRGEHEGDSSESATDEEMEEVIPVEENSGYASPIDSQHPDIITTVGTILCRGPKLKRDGTIMFTTRRGERVLFSRGYHFRRPTGEEVFVPNSKLDEYETLHAQFYDSVYPRLEEEGDPPWSSEAEDDAHRDVLMQKLRYVEMAPPLLQDGTWATRETYLAEGLDVVTLAQVGESSWGGAKAQWFRFVKGIDVRPGKRDPHRDENTPRLKKVSWVKVPTVLHPLKGVPGSLEERSAKETARWKNAADMFLLGKKSKHSSGPLECDDCPGIVEDLPSVPEEEDSDAIIDSSPTFRRNTKRKRE